MHNTMCRSIDLESAYGSRGSRQPMQDLSDRLPMIAYRSADGGRFSAAIDSPPGGRILADALDSAARNLATRTAVVEFDELVLQGRAAAVENQDAHGFSSVPRGSPSSAG